MNTCVVGPEDAAPCFGQGKPAQERTPSASHQKCRTPAPAPVEEQNQTSPRQIGERRWAMRCCSTLWAALAIAMSLFAVPLRAQFAYVANFNSNNVSGYAIDPSTGALTAIAGSPFAAGSFPRWVAVDPSGKFVYVVNEGDKNVSGYTIDPSTGALTAIAGSSFTTGGDPRSMAVDPSGKFAYVADFIGNVLGYTIDPSTGALTTIAGSPFAAGQGPQSVAVDPSGKFAYVANLGGGVSGYTIGPTTGALTPIAGSPFAAGNGPNIGAVDPSGTVAYVTNFSGNNVSGYTIDPSTGALTAIAGSPFAAGGEPFSVAFALTFAGTPGQPNCYGKSVSALAKKYGGLDAAAQALGYPSVQALKNAIDSFCGK
jgi:hypothetical protein